MHLILKKSSQIFRKSLQNTKITTSPEIIFSKSASLKTAFFFPEWTKKTHLLLHHFRSNCFEATLTVRYCQSCCSYFVLNSSPSNVRKVNLRNATLCLKNIPFTYLKIFLFQDLFPPPDKEGSTDVQVEVRKTLWFRLEKIKIDHPFNTQIIILLITICPKCIFMTFTSNYKCQLHPSLFVSQTPLHFIYAKPIHCYYL